MFRIDETDAARPPADIDEAREQLTADLDRLAHYEELVASLNELREQARTAAGSGGNLLKDRTRHLLITQKTISNTTFGRWPRVHARTKKSKVNTDVEAVI